MPKYYVECGNFQIVTHAKNDRGAAIWAIHRALGQVFPFLADSHEDNDAGPAVALGELIKTSQRGFGRSDAALHDTIDVIGEWNRLLVALDRLQEDTSNQSTAV